MSTIHPVQVWEGYVESVGAEEFHARLTDLTSNSPYAGEEAVIPLEAISEDDAHRLCAGRMFLWVIGYEQSSAGKKETVSQIVFRDLPAITEADLRAGQEWAEETIRLLGL